MDVLTQMPNRAALSSTITNALLRHERDAGSRFAVLFLNCDRFKRVNDLYGTAVGDGLLGVMAARLRGVLRSGESIAARVGSDEFVVLLGSLAHSDQAEDRLFKRPFSSPEHPRRALGHAPAWLLGAAPAC